MNAFQDRWSRRLLYATACLSLTWATPVPMAGQNGKPLQPEDLLAVRDVTDLELAPNGREVIYVMKEANLKSEQMEQTIWRVRTDGKNPPVRLTQSEKDTSAQWAPDNMGVTFLSVREGHPQICLLTLENGVVEQLSHAPGGVTKYRWSRDGKHIAFVSADQDKGTFEQAIGNQETGVVIEKKDFAVYKLLRNQLFLDLEKPSSLWVLDVGSQKATRVTTGVNVSSFDWSPDSQSLAFAGRPVPGLSNQRSDVWVYAMGEGNLKAVLQGRGGEDWSDSSGYSNPIWSPDGKRLAVLYREMKDRWAALDRVGILTLEDSSFSLITREEKLELYTPRLCWIEKDQIYLENTERAGRHLFLLSVKDGSERPTGNPQAYEGNFSFSADGRTMAYVRQSLTEPPEVYFAEVGGGTGKKLTELNEGFRAFEHPEFERVHWKAPDGVEVEGWLLKPPGFSEKEKYPLLAFVHGGPGYAVPNRFELYDAWPYPFRIFALRGYLVFLPNYRGTGTYGKAFLEPRDIGTVPADDILSGISYLESRGIVDMERIGILGQSHGGWLGPYVMARKRMFRAAAFAEGSVDIFSIYGHMPGWLNLNVHEYYFGSPYEDPQRYIELSPILHFQGLKTATLLEYGEQSLAIDGLELLTGLWRMGVPHEMVIYPKTGHNISSPVLQLESMKRNLDWFDYWMLGKEDADPKKRTQYERWKRMSAEMEKMRTRAPQVMGR